MKYVSRLIGLFLLQLPLLARAQVNPLNSLQQVGTQVYGTSSADLKVTIGKLVQIVLGFVGIVFILLIIWGGFEWMTSGGNEKKIEMAKKRLTNATIGLVLIVISYSLAYSITSWLSQATST